VETDPNFEPILTLPQDISVLAPPATATQASMNNFEASYPHLRLKWAVPDAELRAATDPSLPFAFQIPAQGGGFRVWQNAARDASTQRWVPQQVPEGNGIPWLWPLVVLTRLTEDPGQHVLDPASLTQEGDATSPIVVLQGITLLGDGAAGPESLWSTIGAASSGSLFDTQAGLPRPVVQDHLTVLLRPSAICFSSMFDPTVVDKRGVLVTPTLFGTTADLPTGTAAPIVPYRSMTCTLAPGRPLLPSQGNRAVVEIVPGKSGACQGQSAVPPACLRH
jgi:hypothetical protein